MHVRVSFAVNGPHGKVRYSVTCYYAKCFDSLRRTCCPSELDFIRSLSRCKNGEHRVGRAMSSLKSLDDRFIIKQVTKTELESFIKFAPEYFKYLLESISTGSPTCLAKILGIYQVAVKNLKGGKESRMDVLVMENLLFGRSVKWLYDLKGSSRSRYNADISGNNKVLLDQNLIEAMPTSPIFVGNKAKRLLERAVWNDTAFLASIDVMDYSLLVGVDENKQELVVGIIDFMRQYTWDKHLETWWSPPAIIPSNSPSDLGQDNLLNSQHEVPANFMQVHRMEQESFTRLRHLVDDFYFSALSDTDQELFPISDELQLQEVLMSAVVASCSVRVRSPAVRTINERGESSSSAPVLCKICMDTAPAAEMFWSSNCSHSFCQHCLSRYIGAKVQENILTVKCPEIECKGVLRPELCQDIVPADVFSRWETALCESMVLASQRFYCPFKDCSALMVDDGQETVRQSECPNCQRLFCAQCKVGWHSGLSCEEFKMLGTDERGRDDLMLMKIAKDKRWKRCPRCRFFVEKTQGCMHITCR
ncbi:Phosphatidylinositol-4-phosphate 5-Kinase [Musa troglodytarum]|nr:Phosphatidylinositol-4-phosphate 5-Kinase [Musa troglodytarum]URE23908.1 Phosphatidylinositol-4-phosphate 5-Kinase [Musa troglodytarum]